jgi:hypothetical protein
MKVTPQIDLYAEYQFAKPDGIPNVFNILKHRRLQFRYRGSRL